MIICKGLNSLINDVENGFSIVGFGAGMVANCIEDLFQKHGLWAHIECFIDNDINKENSFIGIFEKKRVYSLQSFLKRHKTDYVLLITCTAFYPIIQQLDSVKLFNNIHCYIYPELNYEFVHLCKCNDLLLLGNQERIPKTIHYCWFGRGPKSVLAQKCIDSWKKYCQDFKIIEWNEDNYDITKNQYVMEAYSEKKWAYVTDYARLDILYEFGGIYFDTDVEVLKDISPLLRTDAFIAYGEWPCVNSGAGIGASRFHPIIKEMRDNPRNNISFYYPDGTCNLTQNCMYETKILKKYGFSADFSEQCLNGITILTPEIISTGGVLGKYAYVTSNTLALHHNGESWSTEERKKQLTETKKYIYSKKGESI